MTTQRPSKRYLSVNEIAELLNVSRMSVYRLVNSGSLQAYRIGNAIRVRPGDFATFMRGAAMSDLWEEET